VQLGREGCSLGCPWERPEVSGRSVGLRLVLETGHASRKVEQAGQANGLGGE